MKSLGTFLLIAAAALSCREPDSSSSPPSPTGAIEGVVRLVGDELPTPTRLENTTDPEICGRMQTLDDLLVSPENRGIRYAIATLQEVRDGSFPPPGPGRVEIDNSGCRFSPHAAVATVGSTLEARNSDPVLHTTHLYGPADVNISLPVKGAHATRELSRPGLYVVKCDIHGWMQAFVRVDPHPFHAVTDERGRFRIDGVPVGTYVLELWQERLGKRTTEVRVEEGATVSVLIDYKTTED